MISLWQSIPPSSTRGEELAKQKAAATLDTAAEVRLHQWIDEIHLQNWLVTELLMTHRLFCADGVFTHT